jgi:flagellin
MTRLSTGSRINSASDDAAGLAIVQRMTSQINGLNMAVKNANDGISLTQSIEGALVEVVDMLQRLRELAVQSSNDTNSSTDRRYIEDEVALLKAEITRIANNTRYNGTKVLDGTFLAQKLQVGTEGGEVIDLSVSSVSADKLGQYKTVKAALNAVIGTDLTTAGEAVNSVTATEIYTINGATNSKTITPTAKESAKATAAAVNAVSGDTGVTATAKTYAKFFTGDASDTTYSVKINGTTTGNFTWSATNVADAVTKINDISGTTGVTATANAGNTFITLYHSAGADITVENQSTGTGMDIASVDHDGSTANTVIDIAASGGDDSVRVMGTVQFSSSESFSVSLDSGATAGNTFVVAGSGSLSTVSTINLKTQSGASSAIAVLDGAIEKVSSMRADLGAIENRLQHTVSNLMNIAQNTSDSRSRILDADYSVESANLAKAQVLQQAGTAILTQANARPQLVLQLLQ